ncbi:MAG: tetratricopeptide repeat protein [Chitinophagaceae bacterium]
MMPLRPLRFALLWLGMLAISSVPALAQEADTSSFLSKLVHVDALPKTIADFQQAYKQAPGNVDAYNDLLEALMKEKDYKEAEQLIAKQQGYNNSPVLNIDMGNVLAAAGKRRKAEEQYDAAVQAVNGEEIRSQQLANAFSSAGRDDYAIKVYERSRSILQNPYYFANQLARLYAKQGDVDKSLDALLSGMPAQFGGPDETKSMMLELLGTDAGKLKMAQKELIKRINLSPDNTYYTDLLTWLYTQKGDWDGALIQVEALDERTKSNGQKILVFAQQAAKQKQYPVAIKALDVIIEKGKEQPYYAMARGQKIGLAQMQLEDNAAYTKDDVAALVKGYSDFLQDYSQYDASPMVLDYAMIEARYNNNAKAAIDIIEKAIQQPTATKEFIGKAKLDLGDYQVLDGRIWDASLTYSQVDKAFKEDMLGEEARFKNGKLAYYRGDFKWAQAQLNVLKASTSELIANDALDLSVLITENTPDSNTDALLKYSRADLLLFQNKDAEALKELDSITTLYPKHPLQDDVLMLRAQLAEKARDYDKALGYLETVYTKYGKDVLGDDAVFKTAELYEHILKKPEEAKKFYEKLIIDYPGSTFVQIARARLEALSTANSPT